MFGGLFIHSYDHSFRPAKAAFLAELGLVLRSKIAIAPMAKATKRGLKDLSFKLIKCLSSKDINEAMKANKSSENVQKFML